MKKIQIVAVSTFLLLFLITPTFSFAAVKTSTTCQSNTVLNTLFPRGKVFCGKQLNKNITTSIGNFVISHDIVSATPPIPGASAQKVPEDTLYFIDKNNSKNAIDLKYYTGIVGGIDMPVITGIVDLQGKVFVLFKTGAVTLLVENNFSSGVDSNGSVIPMAGGPILAKGINSSLFL
ncbi:MAG: hypothetical protein WCQ32_03845 [bacterium]